MKPPRFIVTDIGLVLETPIPLSIGMREAARRYAIGEYKRRLKSFAGDRREAIVSVIEKLMKNDFSERAIPAHDCDQEVVLYGR